MLATVIKKAILKHTAINYSMLLCAPLLSKTVSCSDQTPVRNRKYFEMLEKKLD